MLYYDPPFEILGGGTSWWWTWVKINSIGYDVHHHDDHPHKILKGEYLIPSPPPEAP